MNIVLLYGGKSGEHEISLKSCSAVARNIDQKHNVSLIFIDKNGRWFLQKNDVIEKLRSAPDCVLGEALGTQTDSSMQVSVFLGGGKEKALPVPCDVVFPVLHGTYGEDGTVQGLLEMAGLPYVGCGVFASAASMDKVHAKILWEHAGLPIVPYRCLTRADINDSSTYDKIVQEAIDNLHFPLFVKPCSAGSSDGASKAENKRELSFALMEAFQWDNKVLIEKAINAREVECSVMGNSITADPSNDASMLKAYGPGEIVPKHVFYDYDAKYNDPDGAELKIPALLTKEKLEYIRETAKKAYKVLDASGLARVDFFIDRDSEDIYLNEINNIPGFTSISMFPKMCESEGLSFTKLLDLLFEQAIQRFSCRQSLCTSRE